MRLSDPVFRQIADSIAVGGDEADTGPAAPAASEGDGGRGSHRVLASTYVEVHGWDEPLEQPSVRIRDLSAGGLGIFQSERMALDQQVIVRLPARSGTEPQASDQANAETAQSILMLCAVAYWEPLAANLYAIGLQFRGQITEQELAERQRELAAEAAELAESAQPAPGVLARITHALGRSRRAAS